MVVTRAAVFLTGGLRECWAVSSHQVSIRQAQVPAGGELIRIAWGTDI